MFPQIAYVKTQGGTLNVRTEPAGLVVDALENGSIVYTHLHSPVYKEGHDWMPARGGWVADEFLVHAEVMYQCERVIDPSLPQSNTVGVTAFKIKLPDQTLKLIEVSGPPGWKYEDYSHLSDKAVVEQAIELYSEFWGRYQYHPVS